VAQTSGVISVAQKLKSRLEGDTDHISRALENGSNTGSFALQNQ